jgi:hypothetical protein
MSRRFATETEATPTIETSKSFLLQPVTWAFRGRDRPTMLCDSLLKSTQLRRPMATSMTEIGSMIQRTDIRLVEGNEKSQPVAAGLHIQPEPAR